MTCFLEDGHLNSHALDALETGALDELGALEVSEHLAFCEPCLARYLAKLEDVELLQPATPTGPAVLAALRRQRLRVGFGRWATVAAAACLMIGLWAGGFSMLLNSQKNTDKAVVAAEPAPQTQDLNVGRHLNNAMAFVDGGLDSVLGNLWATPARQRPLAADAAANQTPAPGPAASSAADASDVAQ